MIERCVVIPVTEMNEVKNVSPLGAKIKEQRREDREWLRALMDVLGFFWLCFCLMIIAALLE